jgi:hypothetical protein
MIQTPAARSPMSAAERGTAPAAHGAMSPCAKLVYVFSLTVAVAATLLVAWLAWITAQRPALQCTPTSSQLDSGDMLGLAGMMIAPCGVAWFVFGAWFFYATHARSPRARALAVMTSGSFLVAFFLAAVSSFC